jgi:LCP family protein required for cell wall assembly
MQLVRRVNSSLYSRLPSAVSVVRPEPHATKAQSVIEYLLFIVFGGALAFAPVALVLASSASHRAIPNLVEMGMAGDRVNVLTIVAPRGRNASSDVLMLVSIKPSTREVAVMSIPADLWVRLGRHGTRRLGTGINVGRTSGYPGGGAGLVADTVSDVLGQRIHAFVQLDAAQLRRMIDDVGGIQLEVGRGVYDAYTRDRFTRGFHYLNGTRAVRYALSRRMAGQANDRFEREARQRAVVTALLSRLSSVVPLRLDLDDQLTNLTADQVAWIADIVERCSLKTVTFAPYVQTFDVTSLIEDGEVLRPRAGFEQLQQVAANIFRD